MLFIAAEYFFIADQLGIEQTGRLHLVQLLADAVVVIPEFILEVAEIIPLGRIQEEFQEQFDSCLRCDERFEQNVNG